MAFNFFKKIFGGGSEQGEGTSETSKNEVNQSKDHPPQSGEGYDYYLDCKQMLCPRPIFEVSKKISSIETGKVLKVECTDMAFEADIHAWIGRMGHDLKYDKEGEVQTALITKK